MARSFDGSGDYLRNSASAAVTGYPCTLHCWVKIGAAPAANADFALLAASKSSALEDFWLSYYNQNPGPGLLVRCVAADSGGANTRWQYIVQTLTVGTWYAITATFNSSSSLQIYINGSSSGSLTVTTGTGTPTPTGLTDSYVGAFHYNTSTLYGDTNGSIAEAAMWSAALDTDEIAALAAGYSPMLVRPDALASYWPLLARTTDEEDWVGGRLLTTTNATASEHPRVIRLRSSRIYGVPEASGVAGTLTATLADATLGATGALAIAGTAAPTLDAATLAATGTLAIGGTGSVALDAATLAATGAAGVTGTAAVTLDAATVSATGTLAIAGTATQTLADATVAGTGTLAIAGALTGTLADAALAATGVLGTITTGALDATLEAATVAATGTLAIAGTATPTLADATTAATGTVAIAGTATVTLDAATVVAAGNITISGALAQTLADAAVAATGAAGAVRTGVLAVTLANATMAARVYPSTAGPLGSMGRLQRPPEAHRAKQAAERRPPNRR